MFSSARSGCVRLNMRRIRRISSRGAAGEENWAAIRRDSVGAGKLQRVGDVVIDARVPRAL